jgi:hypothetical protein
MMDPLLCPVLCSTTEAELIMHYCPTCKVVIVSNIHDSASLARPTCAPRSGVLFVGSMAHQPNQQAIKHLLIDVLPHILQQLPALVAPAFKVHIVGGSKEVPGELAQLFAANAAHAVYHGWLPDEMLALLYSRVKVVVAPLLSGAGVKGKVSTGMYMHPAATRFKRVKLNLLTRPQVLAPCLPLDWQPDDLLGVAQSRPQTRVHALQPSVSASIHPTANVVSCPSGKPGHEVWCACSGNISGGGGHAPQRRP